jgi:hypothetical protein
MARLELLQAHLLRDTNAMTTGYKFLLESELARQGYSAVVEGRRVGDVFQVTVWRWDEMGKLPAWTHAESISRYATLGGAADGAYRYVLRTLSAARLEESLPVNPETRVVRPHKKV